MLFVLLAFSIQLGSEWTYILIPVPVTTAILTSAIMIAQKSRSSARQHFYYLTFRKQEFLWLTIPEIYLSIRSDLRQTLLYSVLMVVVLEYIQQPLSGRGIGAHYYQLFATPPAPQLLFAMALPPLLVVSVVGAIVVSFFDLGMESS
ncbi:MAG: hypothetical protein JST30_01525 [Armatimonadetes bacterium]|nr:hypothetical protein [Armatimonadota bacterium]